MHEGTVVFGLINHFGALKFHMVMSLGPIFTNWIFMISNCCLTNAEQMENAQTVLIDVFDEFLSC